MEDVDQYLWEFGVGFAAEPIGSSHSVGSGAGGLVLLNPGPAGTSARVKNALLRGDLCHREPEFSDLLGRLRSGIPRALNLADTHEAIVVSGSGTAAMEMATLSSVRRNRAILVINNGVYGERLLGIARAHGITAYQVAPPGAELRRWTTPIDPRLVARALAEHPDVDAVACVQHETTVGLINPIREIGEIVATTDAVFVVDAISGTGNEDLDLADAGADLIGGTANKGLHGLPGISFLLCGAAGARRIKEASGRGLYLSAATYLERQRNGDVPFTPAIQICYALDEALTEYAEQGGFPIRVEMYRGRAAIVRRGFAELGLDILVAPEFRSNSVTTIRLPENVTYPRLHDELKKRGYVIYASQGGLAERFFRICTFGEIPQGRLEALGLALGESLVAARRLPATSFEV
jgi:2-aminoethylphosphonate-pyruvate transaminase